MRVHARARAAGQKNKAQRVQKCTWDSVICQPSDGDDGGVALWEDPGRLQMSKKEKNGSKLRRDERLGSPRGTRGEEAVGPGGSGGQQGSGSDDSVSKQTRACCCFFQLLPSGSLKK